jgi:cyclophilin family peptidyl-prolyl cis-trans isomerase
MSADFTGTLSGMAFLDSHHDGKFDTGDLTMAGVPIKLTGTTTGGTNVSIVTNTDAKGHYSFINVAPGSYQITSGPVSGLLNAGAGVLTATDSVGIAQVSESGTTVTVTTTGTIPFTSNQTVTIAGVTQSGYDGTFPITVTGTNTFTYTAAANLPTATLANATASSTTLQLGSGQTLTHNFAYSGRLNPAVISIADFLTSTTGLSVRFGPVGKGTTAVNPQPDNAPLVSTAIAPVTVAANASPTQIDLAGHFTDPDLANSQITFVTNLGKINVTLFDKTDPQTVANFYDYINTGRFDNNWFFRLAKGFVLQGGGVTMTPSGATFTTTAVTANPAVPSEFSISNTANTIAMALPGGNANGGTDQFFFNLVDNSKTLDSQKFTVFGKISDSASLAVLHAISNTAATNVINASGSVSISKISEVGTTVTVTTTDPIRFATNQSLTISGVTPSGYDGSFKVTVTGPNTFTYTAASGLGTATLSSATAALPSVGISSISESGTTVTVTTANAVPFTNGESVTISGVTPSGYNGTFTVTVTGTNTFTYTAASGLAAATTTGATAASFNAFTATGFTFAQVPLRNVPATANFPSTATPANFFDIQKVIVVKRNDFLTYKVLSNSNPGLVNPVIDTTNSPEWLTLNYTPGQAGTASIVVEAIDKFGATVTQTIAVTVSSALTDKSTAVASTGTEGGAVNNVIAATFTDSNTGDHSADFTAANGGSATIHWGDGQTSTGSVAFNASSSIYTVTGSHTYAEQGTFNVTVDLSDGKGSSLTGVGKTTVTVGDAPLQDASSVVTASATEGAASGNIAVATFTDANPGDQTADFTGTGSSVLIHWGDGQSSAGTVSFDATSGKYTVQGSHTYATHGSYNVTVDVVEVGGSTLTGVGKTTVTVTDAPLHDASTAVTANAFEGITALNVVVAAFTDDNPGDHTTDFGAGGGGGVTIHWGDGQTSVGLLSFDSTSSTYTITGSHAYAEPGSYTVTVDVTDGGGSTLTGIGKTSVTVTDATLTDVSTPVDVTASANTDTGTVVAATFTDANIGDHTTDFIAGIVIHWGDGQSTTGSVAYDPVTRAYTVTGHHVYTTPATYNVTVDVTDVDNSTILGIGQTTITVS